jgi:hypothetical protein
MGKGIRSVHEQGEMQSCTDTVILEFNRPGGMPKSGKKPWKPHQKYGFHGFDLCGLQRIHLSWFTWLFL